MRRISLRTICNRRFVVLLCGVAMTLALLYQGQSLLLWTSREGIVLLSDRKNGTTGPSGIKTDLGGHAGMEKELEGNPSLSQPDRGPLESSSPPITNNYVIYPRLSQLAPETLYAMRDRHIAKLQSIIANPLPKFWQYNAQQLKTLIQAWENVGKDNDFQQPAVVLSTYGYVPCVMNRPVCSTTGEVIWLEGVTDVFKEQNHFLLYDEFENLGNAYKFYGDIVTHVWSSEPQVIWCINDPISCIQSEDNPDGIKIWQLFTFTFWGSPPNFGTFYAPEHSWSFNPLGGEWNLVPYQMPDKHFYLGYHFTGCEDTVPVPHAEKKDQVVVLAKRSEYFHFAGLFKPDFWSSFKQGLPGLDLISVSNEEEGYPVPEELTLLGPQDRRAYDLLLGSSKALFGIGRPKISPTPYASLCRGVPVVLPYDGRYCTPVPNINQSEWCGFHGVFHQHGAAATLGEPYVYMVNSQGPVEDIVRTVRRAVNTPIEPFQPPEMTREALTQRIRDYFYIDWQAYGRQKLVENGWDSWEQVNTQQFLYKYLAESEKQGKRIVQLPPGQYLPTNQWEQWLKQKQKSV
ncbi:hypothetical protein K435DRAFT_835038 [Dendrothele bispora CBS 962.96]|uniref:Glycosyltransferase family 18 catalytic domain-containing protein n=1 Tax=Dendrothele bispora (strain CBS 962.96) TaxID=1314807 RepID=A0A4S8MPZ8_DENBC|nr:hypothetical protein K435DRAFT_835038 [Dendrothele bispora CBS 962.96]